MADRTFIETLSFVLAVTLGLVACAPYPPHGPPPPPPRPAYYYDYYYYPHADVYFQIYTGEYYYRHGNTWRRSRTLPRNIYLHPRDREHLRIRDKKPYARDHERRAAERASGHRYNRDPERNRQERQHNRRSYEQYRKNYGR
jgi:hypothetical protein